MKISRTSLLGWLFGGILIILGLIQIPFNLKSLNANADPLALAEGLAWSLLPIAFASVAILIISRQPRNTIGWLLMGHPILIAAFPLEAYINQFSSAPPEPSAWLLLALWLGNWSWLLLIFPILFIPLLFPTGRPPSPRWRWLIYAGLGMCGFLIFVSTFQSTLGPISGEMEGAWSVPNPIGFLSMDYFPYGLWFLALILLTVFCFASLIVRYRRAGAREREQIKWLLYACGLFVAAYLLTFLTLDQGTLFINFLFPLATMTIPIAIGIAILQYRLWDIDILIRRTLIYGALVILLALVYFGSVLVLQNLISTISGQESSLAIVISTLAIAALFTPLRNRIQRTIDRRFYRQRYDAARTLATFNAQTREEVDLERLSHSLLEAVDDTLKPQGASLWIRRLDQ